MILGSFIFKRIPDQWLASKTASGLFAASSITIIVMTPIWFGYVTVPDTACWQIISGVLGAACAFSVLFLWTGMWRYWMKCDASTRTVKRVWFFVLLFGLWYGAILYYLLKYLRRDKNEEVKTVVNEAN